MYGELADGRGLIVSHGRIIFGFSFGGFFRCMEISCVIILIRDKDDVFYINFLKRVAEIMKVSVIKVSISIR